MLVLFFAGGCGGNSNPLYPEYNSPIEFGKLNAEHIKSATEHTIDKAKQDLKAIYAIKAEDRTFDNTMLTLDNIYNEIGSRWNPIYLMGSTHPDSLIRTQGLESRNVFSKYNNELNLDEELYRAVKEYAATSEAAALTGYRQKFLKETLRGFERNGFALDKDKRVILKEIQDRIADLGNEFQKNIASHDDFLIVNEAEIDGLPQDYKESRRTEDGNYKIDLSYPSYRPFMQYSISETARKKLFMKYLNRAADKNLDVLDKILVERKKLADLLGYRSFAEYQVEERMAKNPARVWDFENSLMEKVKVKAKQDYAEMLATKRALTKNKYEREVKSWESSYVQDILLKEKYQVDNEKVKEYFELNNVTQGLFKITQHLFGLEFKEIAHPSVWHKDVRAYEVSRDGKTISRFYLDLHPRPNKYTHAACFPISPGKRTAQGYQMPSASLVCNFPQATAERPALMPHSQVITFFHEFGHVLHNMLTTADLSVQSGTSTSRDFVEAPSQIFENWAWNYDALKMFAKHYETGEILPQELFDKMLAAKNVNSGINTSYQIFYGVLDFTLHDKYDPAGKETTTQIVRKLQGKITPYPYVEGTHFQAAFGHLFGYAAGYYGYLWSKVYAQDMFSIFEKNGIMDKETGYKYRDIILASGGSRNELDLVKDFLGREPNDEAFLRELGL